MDPLDALQTIARTRDLWLDFNIEELAKPRLFSGKRQRLSRDAARGALDAFESLGISPCSLKSQDADTVNIFQTIDAQIDYGLGSTYGASRAIAHAPEACDALPACYCTSEVRERFHELSLSDDRKKKGRCLWLDFETLEHMADSSHEQPWRTDLSQRARYLRAQNCLMQALGPCGFNPMKVIAFADARNTWAEACGCQWIADYPLPNLTQAVGSIYDSNQGNLTDLTEEFIRAWTAYQDEVQRVYCLWKGWKGLRASAIAQHDFGLDMLKAYASLLQCCSDASTTIERASAAIRAFGRILGSHDTTPVFGSRFCPQLDPVTPQEHERRSIQSAKSQAERKQRRVDYSEPVSTYIEDESYHAIGTLDDYFQHRWRYSDDFFDATPPWERSSSPGGADSKK